MQLLLSYHELASKNAECRRCRWKGKAADLPYGEYHEQSHLGDLVCPHCNELLGYVKFPVGSTAGRARKSL
jgi:hypothetical protein